MKEETTKSPQHFWCTLFAAMKSGVQGLWPGEWKISFQAVMAQSYCSEDPTMICQGIFKHEKKVLLRNIKRGNEYCYVWLSSLLALEDATRRDGKWMIPNDGSAKKRQEIWGSMFCPNQGEPYECFNMANMMVIPLLTITSRAQGIIALINLSCQCKCWSYAGE